MPRTKSERIGSRETEATHLRRKIVGEEITIVDEDVSLSNGLQSAADEESQHVPCPDPMTRAEAEKTVRQIVTGMINVRQSLLQLYRRDGWKALGYARWADCIASEFGVHARAMRYSLRAARTEEELQRDGVISQDEHLPDSQLLALADAPEGQTAVVLAEARERASALKEPGGRKGVLAGALSAQLITEVIADKYGVVEEGEPRKKQTEDCERALTYERHELLIDSGSVRLRFSSEGGSRLYYCDMGIELVVEVARDAESFAKSSPEDYDPSVSFVEVEVDGRGW